MSDFLSLGFGAGAGQCPAGPHRGPQGPNEDLSQCPQCLAPSWSLRPAGETIGLHAEDCSLPERHEGECVGGGIGHPPAEVVRGYWPGMDDNIEAARTGYQQRRSAAAAAADRTPVSVVVDRLGERLGPTLLASAAGQHDRALALAWLLGTEEPPQEVHDRLRFTLRAIRSLERHDGPGAHLTWLLVSNPLTDPNTPMGCIRDGDLLAVDRALTAHLGELWCG